MLFFASIHISDAAKNLRRYVEIPETGFKSLTLQKNLRRCDKISDAAMKLGFNGSTRTDIYIIKAY